MKSGCYTALVHARQRLGLNRVMISCDRDHTASRKAIEKCGGKLERKFIHVDGKTVLIFWIELQ